MSVKDPRVPVPPVAPIVPQDGTDLVSMAAGVAERIVWPSMFGSGEPVVIEIYPDGRVSVNEKFVETPAQTVDGLAAANAKLSQLKGDEQ